MAAVLALSACQPNTPAIENTVVADPGPGQIVSLRVVDRVADVVAVPYGADPQQTLDVWHADPNVAARGTIVFAHSGYFAIGSSSAVLDEAGVVMAQLARGFSVVSVNYRLLTPTQHLAPSTV